MCPHTERSDEEKRRSPRFPWSAKISLTLLPSIEGDNRPGRVVRPEAEAENIAKDGIGIFCDRPLPRGTAVRCEIELSDQEVHIPTLMQVRWTDFSDGEKRYRAGLQFLL